MSRQNWRNIAIVGAVLVIASILAGLFWPANTQGEPASADEPAGECSKADTVSAVLVAAGFTPDQFTVGEERFDLTLPAALEAGNGRFADRPHTSLEAFIGFLNSNEPAAEALIGQLVQTAGVTREQVLDPGNWEGFQLLINSEWSGNTLFVDGEVKPAGTRHSDVGDIGWVLVNPEDCSTNVNLVRVAIVRMGCSNPQLVPPNPPGMPPPPEQPHLPPPPPPELECPEEGTVPDEENPGRCRHISITEPDPCASHPELNIDVCQPPQDNNPDLVGPTPGAPPEPYVPPPGPEPEDDTVAPPPNDGGYDSGSEDGSGTPDGTACDVTSCDGGGPAPPPNDPEDSGQGGDNTGTVPPPP